MSNLAEFDIAEAKLEHRRNKKFPPDVVRKRKTYHWWVQMIKEFEKNKNKPEENLRILYRELANSGGYFTKKGALMQYKVESMEQAINDYNETKNETPCV